MRDRGRVEERANDIATSVWFLGIPFYYMGIMAFAVYMPMERVLLHLEIVCIESSLNR
jgi:hypothetical protein